MDEEAAAAQWAERESNRLEGEERTQYQARAQRYGLYKKEAGKEALDNDAIDRAVDSRSVLVQRQQQIKKERARQEQLAKQKQAKKANSPSDPNANVSLINDMPVSPWTVEYLAKLGTLHSPLSPDPR